VKNGKIMILAALLILGLIAGSAWAGNQPGPVETNTETQQAELGECPAEPLQIRAMVQRLLLQSQGEHGEEASAQVQRQRFGR